MGTHKTVHNHLAYMKVMLPCVSTVCVVFAFCVVEKVPDEEKWDEEMYKMNIPCKKKAGVDIVREPSPSYPVLDESMLQLVFGTQPV